LHDINDFICKDPSENRCRKTNDGLDQPNHCPGQVGAKSLRDIAAGLNAKNILMSRGDGEWTATQVSRVLE